MPRTEPRTPALLPAVSFTPEEAAAVAVALATRPAGPYAVARRAALAKVARALEPDPHERVRLLAAADRMSAGPRSQAHPAGRRRAAGGGASAVPAGTAPERPAGEASARPCLTLLPGGLG